MIEIPEGTKPQEKALPVEWISGKVSVKRRKTCNICLQYELVTGLFQEKK